MVEVNEALLDSPELELIRAESGMEALSRTLDHEFALVLLDVQMPDMDGYETAELMRGNKKTRNIPIIFITAADKDREHIFKGYDAGAVDYLFKPLEPAVLQGKVNIFLELHRQRVELEAKTRELDARVAEMKLLQKELEATNEKLLLLSSLDGLTGLSNRRCFDEILEKEWQRGLRNRTPLSLIIADIDYFKAYNDSYGHIQGDTCLKQVAGCLHKALFRDMDMIGRYGGEEFSAILPDTDAQGAEFIAHRMLKAVVGLSIPHHASPTASHVTISLGVATRIPHPDISSSDLIDMADKALYQAKESGRNCCRMGGGGTNDLVVSADDPESLQGKGCLHGLDGGADMGN